MRKFPGGLLIISVFIIYNLPLFSLQRKIWMEYQCILQNITNNHPTYKYSQMITRSGKIILTLWRGCDEVHQDLHEEKIIKSLKKWCNLDKLQEIFLCLTSEEALRENWLLKCQINSNIFSRQMIPCPILTIYRRDLFDRTEPSGRITKKVTYSIKSTTPQTKFWNIKYKG